MMPLIASIAQDSFLRRLGRNDPALRWTPTKNASVHIGTKAQGLRGTTQLPGHTIHCPASRPTTNMVVVPLTENHSGQVYLALAVRLATPEGCSAGRLCLTHTGFRLAGQRGVGLLVSIAVVVI